jgi:hypothetical protein
MRDEAVTRTGAGLSKLWDGKEVDRLRGSEGMTILYGRRLSVHLMAQPGVAATMLANPVLVDQGLISRCLVAAPESAAGERFWREPDPASDLAIKAYDTALLKILRRPLPLAVNKENELEPPILRLSDEARDMWIEFADDTERKLKQCEGRYSPIPGFANKLPEHAARLAGVLTLVEDITATEISADALASGIELAVYYAEENLRLTEIGRTDEKLLAAQEVLDWIHKNRRDGTISLREIYRGLRAIRDKATAVELVDMLVDHGWLVPIPKSATYQIVRRG